MATPGPDAIVREPEARASVEELTKGLAEDARRAGILPPMRAIEDVAKQVTGETIARHEEAFRHVARAKTTGTRHGASAARLDQGVIEDDLGTIRKVERAYDPRRHAAKKQKLVPMAHAIEARLAAERVALLMSIAPGSDGQAQWVYPEWAERIHRVHRQTLSLSKSLDLGPAQAESDAADAVLAILDMSSASFGDWRSPKGPDGKPLYFIPAAK